MQVFIPLWGMIGIWTDKIGFHNTWEFWAYNAVFGLGQAPYYAYSQTMMSELTPPGFEGSEHAPTQMMYADVIHQCSLVWSVARSHSRRS